ncbi:hypothetical protein [Deinococcus multiflagellatus]|uniref:Uncharacterized protein n=1 Tax=Deinococcus multiflagellatus TaxID=1656887 RepID=A0ABW1ZSW7_9DEIO|nr:hypothetical protein [Deinococcus multiflagellatus]MBZ9714479.1 hypothetical protein [Deinococcus multiflagellatus]
MPFPTHPALAARDGGLNVVRFWSPIWYSSAHPDPNTQRWTETVVAALSDALASHLLVLLPHHLSGLIELYDDQLQEYLHEVDPDPQMPRERLYEVAARHDYAGPDPGVLRRLQTDVSRRAQAPLAQGHPELRALLGEVRALEHYVQPTRPRVPLPYRLSWDRWVDPWAILDPAVTEEDRQTYYMAINDVYAGHMQAGEEDDPLARFGIHRADRIAARLWAARHDRVVGRAETILQALQGLAAC